MCQVYRLLLRDGDLDIERTTFADGTQVPTTQHDDQGASVETRILISLRWVVILSCVLSIVIRSRELCAHGVLEEMMLEIYT